MALFLSFGLALLKELTEKGFSTQDQVEKYSKLIGIPILGSIPFIKEISNMLSLESDKDSKENNEISANRFLCSESFRSLVTSIRFNTLSDDLVNTLLITSTKPSEGKTTITSHLAKTLADLGNKVILIDGDMRRPAIHKFFKIDNVQGLSNLIADSKLKIDEIILKTSTPNLEIITAGICPPNPVYLLSSDQMNKLYKNIIGMNYDYPAGSYEERTAIILLCEHFHQSGTVLGMQEGGTGLQQAVIGQRQYIMLAGFELLVFNAVQQDMFRADIQTQ